VGRCRVDARGHVYLHSERWFGVATWQPPSAAAFGHRRKIADSFRGMAEYQIGFFIEHPAASRVTKAPISYSHLSGPERQFNSDTTGKKGDQFTSCGGLREKIGPGSRTSLGHRLSQPERSKNPSKVAPYSAPQPTDCPQRRRPRKCSYKPPHSVNRAGQLSRLALATLRSMRASRARGHPSARSTGSRWRR
jgi:hypothetical protein